MRSPRTALAIAVLGAGAIGVVDYLTGPLLSLSAFYLVPAAWVTISAGRRAGWVVAAASAASGLVSDVVLQPQYRHRIIATWNVAIMVVTLVVVVELVDRIRLRAVAASMAEQRSREFLAAAAHQLRTPLATIRSTVDALFADDDHHSREELLGGLARESARAGRLAGALLRIARLDQHEALPLRPTELNRLVGTEIERARSAWPDVGWHLQPGPDTPSILCSPDALAEALAALFDNARRHARTCVTTSVRVTEDFCEVAVADDGLGLPPGREAAAFRRFVSLDGRGGSGLGLPIARGIAEAHGGTLTYAQGRFTLRLPRRHPPGGQADRPAR